MIAGTPVLDIKPYIPEYDSPHTRSAMEAEQNNKQAEQLQPNTASPEETPDSSNMDSEDSETEAEPDLKPETFTVDAPPATAQLSLSNKLHSVLQDVRAYVARSEPCQVSCESGAEVSDAPDSNTAERPVDRPHYGEEACSTIAGWLRAPPVGSLEVRFTPHAQRELAEFLPAHLSGKSDLRQGKG